MKKLVLSLAATPLILGALSVQASAAEEGFNILSDVKVAGQIRPRYENASSSADGDVAAQAATARTNINLSANLFQVENLTANIGVTSVNSLGLNNNAFQGDDGSDATNKIVDPLAARINVGNMNYKINKTNLMLGRAVVNLDNQRFIGSVGWRQMEASLDVAAVSDNSVENLKLFAAYAVNANTVKGTAVDTNSALFNANYKVMDELSVTGYAYMMSSLSDTYGLALTGKVGLGEGMNLTYRAEYAMQTEASLETRDTTNATSNVSGNYVNVDVGGVFAGVIAGLNYEMLSGTDGDATNPTAQFNPAFGTNHKFNGWADVFYVGNAGYAGGLNDLNVRLGYKAKGIGKFLVMYHMFSENTATAGSAEAYGNELDLLYANKVPGVNGLSGLIKYAMYMDDTSTNKGVNKDVSKAWLGLDYKFKTN